MKLQCARVSDHITQIRSLMSCVTSTMCPHKIKPNIFVIPLKIVYKFP